MTLYTPVLMALILVVGCKTTDGDDDKAWDGFVVQYAEYYCDLREDCDPALFGEEFGDDPESCKKAVLTNENKGRQKHLEDDCDFDTDKADECIEVAATLSCQGWVDGELAATCDQVWDCP